MSETIKKYFPLIICNFEGAIKYLIIEYKRAKPIMKNSSLLSTPNVLFMYGILIYNDERIKIRNNENTVIVIPVPMEHKYIS